MNLEFFLSALAGYFVIIDPIGMSLIFNSLTEKHNSHERKKIAFRAIFLSIIIVAAFGIGGEWILSKLGIAIDSFRIAGGLLLFYAAFHMATQGDSPAESDHNEIAEDISVFPLSFPLIAGPGCLTMTILLFAKARTVEMGLPSIIVAILIVYALTLIGFLGSDLFKRLIGDTANRVLKRLLGLLLAALSVQFIADGIRGLITG
jgi:multiple antibiotic resistance protein